MNYARTSGCALRALALCAVPFTVHAAHGAGVSMLVSRTDGDVILRYNYPTPSPFDVFGTAPQLDGPAGMALGPNGNVYVASMNNGRVVAFDQLSGVLLGTFAVFSGTPTDVEFGADGNLYVADAANDVVRAFSGLTGMFLGIFASSMLLDDPMAMEFGPDGNLYVLSTGTGRVLAFDRRNGRLLSTFASGVGMTGGDMTFGPDGNLYVSDIANNRILRFNGVNGQFLDVFAQGSFLGHPDGIKFGPDGLLYVVSTDTSAVLRFRPNGSFNDVYTPGIGPDGPGMLLFVPEPGSLLMLGACGALILRRR